MQRYNKKLGYANFGGFFSEFPEDPDRCAILEGEVSAQGCARRDGIGKGVEQGIQSLEMDEGGMSESNSDAMDKVKLKREPDDSRT